MGKFNRSLVFSAPLMIYALGLWGSRQALIGTIVYMVWIFIGLDEAEYKHKKKTRPPASIIVSKEISYQGEFTI